MTISEVTQIGTLIIASAAGYVSIRTFQRTKKQEFENQLFKIKLEAFSNLVFEIDKFFIVLDKSLVQLRHIKSEHSAEKTSEKLMNLSSHVDDQMYLCHSLIVKYSVYFSENSIKNFWSLQKIF